MANSEYVTNVYDRYGNRYKGIIRDGLTYLEDGSRIPVGWSVETKGGLYRMGDDGVGYKIDKLEFESRTPERTTRTVERDVPRRSDYSDRLQSVSSYTPSPPPRFDFDRRQFDDYFSEMERVQLEKMRQARERRRQVLENQKGRINTEYDKVIGDINLQKEQAAPRYHQARNQADAIYFDNARRLEEMLAHEGTIGGGKNVSANLGLMGQRLGVQSDLHQAEQEFYDKADKAIQDAIMDRAQRIAEIDEAIANLEAQGIDDESLLMAELRAERFRLELEMAKFEANYNLQVYGMENEYGFRREDMDLRRLQMLSDYDFQREQLDLSRYGMDRDYEYKDWQRDYAERQYSSDEYWRERQFQADQGYKNWQRDYAERELQRVLDNDAWNRSKDNPAVQAQMLQNAIAELELQYLPEYKKLGLQQLKAEINALNRPSSSSVNPYELEMARLKLENLVTGRLDDEVNKYQSQINNLNFGNPTTEDKIKYIGNLGKSGRVSEEAIDQLLLLNGLPTNQEELRKLLNKSSGNKKEEDKPWYQKLWPGNWFN